jgi:hypothetical protein
MLMKPCISRYVSLTIVIQVIKNFVSIYIIKNFSSQQVKNRKIFRSSRTNQKMLLQVGGICCSGYQGLVRVVEREEIWCRAATQMLVTNI